MYRSKHSASQSGMGSRSKGGVEGGYRSPIDKSSNSSSRRGRRNCISYRRAPKSRVLAEEREGAEGPEAREERCDELVEDLEDEMGDSVCAHNGQLMNEGRVGGCGDARRRSGRRGREARRGGSQCGDRQMDR